MKTSSKYLLATSLLLFTAWMAVLHEPKSVIEDAVEGVVTAAAHDRSVKVKLSDGKIVEAEAPRQLPKQPDLHVKLEITAYQWTDQRNYLIKSWSSQ